MAVKGRVSHERTLCKLLMEDTRGFATRTGGTSMPWADVHLYRQVGGGVWSECVIIEVKSSVKKKKRFIPREVKQFERYLRTVTKYGLPIYYAFRWVTREEMPERKKWRFFDARGIHNHKMNWEDGMTYKQFLERL